MWNPDRGLYTSWAILYLDAWKRAVPQFHSVFIKNLNRRPVLFSVIWYNCIEAMAILNIFWCICHSFFHNQKLNWLKTNLEASFLLPCQHIQGQNNQDLYDENRVDGKHKNCTAWLEQIWSNSSRQLSCVGISKHVLSEQSRCKLPIEMSLIPMVRGETKRYKMGSWCFVFSL